VGTTSPNARLNIYTSSDVDNTYIRASSNNNYALTVYNGGGSGKGVAVNVGNTGSDAASFVVNDAVGTTNFFTVTDGNSYFQNGNVGIGSLTNDEKLNVGGAIALGNSATNTPGAIRWDGADFQGYNGTNWISLTSEGIVITVPSATKVKTVSETVTSNNTLQDDDELFFNIGANETWTFRVTAHGTSGTTPDFRFGVSAPSGATCRYSGIDAESTVTTPLITSCNTPTAVLAGNGASDTYELVGVVTNGTTPGTVRFKWAQNTSDP
jgi:hypothetical protein